MIVVDDGSADDTHAVLAALRDPRVAVLTHTENRGAQAARNTGIRAARGRYVAFLDSDDEWVPRALELRLARFGTTGQDVGVVHGRYVARASPATLAHEVRIPPLRGRVYRELLASPGPLFQAMMVRRECLEVIGGLDESIRAYQEWDTAIRLARHYAFEWVPEILGIYHLHGGESISRHSLLGVEGYLQVVRAHHEEIVKHGGRAALSHHYWIAAGQYAAAGHMALARHCLRQALRHRPISLRALVGLLLTPLGPRRYTQLLDTMRGLWRGT